MESYNIAELALTLFEEAGDALVLFDPDSEQVIDVNPTAQRLSGFTRKELLRMQASYLFRSEEQGGLSRLRHAFKKTAVFHSQEGFLLRNRQDGVWIPLNLTLARLHVKPKTLGLITARDIREQRDAHSRLKKAEERLRTVVSNAPVILFALDRTGVFTLMEGKGLESQDIKPEELLGRSIFDVYGKVPAIVRTVQRVLTGEPATLAIDLTHGPGAGRSFESHYSPLRDRQGQVIGAIGIATDITDRRRAEEQVKEVTAFLNSIIDNIPIMLFVKDAEHLRFERHNRAAEELLGINKDDLIGKNDYDFFPPDEADFFIAKDREVLREKKLLDIPEEVIITRVGERILHTKKIPLLDENGIPRHLVGISEDITERKRAEEKLQQSEERFRLLVEAVKDYAIFLLDPLGQVISWNAGAQRIKGYRAAEIVGQHVSCFYVPEAVQRGKPQHDLERAVVEGRCEHESWWVRKGDSRFWAHVVTTALLNEAGNLKGFSVIVRDLTERKRAEQAERTLHAHETESNIARQIQRKLFPVAAPRLPGYEIGGMSYPAVATGGDYFDYIPMFDGTLGLAIGDAAGHGSGPALLMASTRAYLRSLALTHANVGTILTLTNHVLAADVGERFITLILARFDPAARSLIYASAGHPPGYVFDQAGNVKTLLKSSGLPLGIAPGTDYVPAAPITLQPGEIVLLLTDGITEACSRDGHSFGIERALAVVHARRCLSAQEIVAALYAEVCAFCAGTPPFDDITAVVLKVDP